MKFTIGAVAFFFLIENFAFGAEPIKLFEGDILLPKYEMDNLDAFLNGTLYTGFTRNAVAYPHQLWPGGVVPYTFSTLQQVSEEARNVIIEAMKVYEEKTCIRFKPLEDEKSNIEFFAGEGCYSEIGKMSLDGTQVVSIGMGCESLETVLHELMHAIGFYHEQSRADRDEYVRIIEDNIEPGKKDQFQKHDLTVIKHLGEEYDYCSIMHYGARYFSKDGDSPTIVPIKETECAIGMAMDFSATDLRKINKLYECGGGQEITTFSGGGHDITTEPIETCQDHDEACSSLIMFGYCESSTYNSYMAKNCKKSCGFC